MSIFDQAYDEMTLTEVCSRLPGELAIKAITRRINDLPSLLDFVKTVGSQPSFVKDLSAHINDVFSKYSTQDILNTFEQGLHPSLFAWLNDGNKNRLKNEGKDKISTTFLFNLSGSKELDSLKSVLENVLGEQSVRQSAVLSVLNKADQDIFPQLLDIVVKDQRPEVRECILAISTFGNNQLVSDLQKTIALKAFVKSGQLRAVNVLDFKLFSTLKPLERLTALAKYLNYFPTYRQVKVFDPSPTEDEFNLILFAGCIEHNDLVSKLSKQYKEITEEDAPEEEAITQDAP